MPTRPTLRATLLATAILAWLLPPLAAQPLDPGRHAGPRIYARIDIDAAGPASLQELKETPGIEWWVELDDRLLVLASEPALTGLERLREVERLDIVPRRSRLHLVQGAHRDELAAMDVDVLALGRHSVVQARHDGRPALPRADPAHLTLLAFEPDRVLARQAANQGPPRISLAPETEALIDEVDEQRWFDALSALASFSRYTRGSEIDDARDWLVEQLAALPGFDVTTQSFQVDGTTAWNVIATLTGSVRPQDLYIVGGHYDATSEIPFTAAPGAEDNASGCAGVLEMAQIFAAHPPEATILFICFSGEEQGLFGSRDHASRLVAAGLADQVQAMLNMDMIGFTIDSDLDCLLETSPAHAFLADVFAAAAELTELRVVLSWNPGGSDHVPYIDRGMPALLAIENDWFEYACYHRSCDLPGNLGLAMGREILKMSAAALGQMIGYGTPIFVDGFESGDTSAWSETVIAP